MICTATNCDTRPGDGITLCHEHTTQLENHLEEIPGVLADLGAAAIRSTRYAEPVTAAKGELALIVDFEATALGRELAALVHSWVSLILDHGAATSPDDARSPASCARWLRGQMPTVRVAEWAGDMCDELAITLWSARKGTDRKPPRVFAGMCPTDTDDIVCGSPLYAKQGAGFVRCRVCGADWDVDGWRYQALQAAAMETGTAAQVSRMLSDPVTGEALPQGTIRSWVSRGLLTHVNEWDRRMAGVFGKPIPQKRYQVRKVRNLWIRMKASKYGNPTLRSGSATPDLVA